MAVKVQKGAVRSVIRAHRAKLGKSQTEFGQHLNTNAATVQRWDAGTAKPSGLLVARLIKSGVDVDDLIQAFETDLNETEA